MVEVIYDKSKASSQSTVKLEDGKFVRAENVVAVAGEGGGGGSGGSTTAAQVSMTPLPLVNASDVQAGMQIVDTELSNLQGQIGNISTALTAILGE